MSSVIMVWTMVLNIGQFWEGGKSLIRWYEQRFQMLADSDKRMSSVQMLWTVVSNIDQFWYISTILYGVWDIGYNISFIILTNIGVNIVDMADMTILI